MKKILLFALLVVSLWLVSWGGKHAANPESLVHPLLIVGAGMLGGILAIVVCLLCWHFGRHEGTQEGKLKTLGLPAIDEICSAPLRSGATYEVVFTFSNTKTHLPDGFAYISLIRPTTRPNDLRAYLFKEPPPSPYFSVCDNKNGERSYIKVSNPHIHAR